MTFLFLPIYGDRDQIFSRRFRTSFTTFFLSQYRKHFHPTSSCENSINLSLKAKKKRRRNSWNWNNYSWPPRITNYRNGSSSRDVLRHETDCETIKRSSIKELLLLLFLNASTNLERNFFAINGRIERLNFAG